MNGEVIHIQQLDPGDRNCENYAFLPYQHKTPSGADCAPTSTTLIRLSDLVEKDPYGYWSCHCGTVLEYYIPLDSDVEKEL